MNGNGGDQSSGSDDEDKINELLAKRSRPRNLPDTTASGKRGGKGGQGDQNKQRFKKRKLSDDELRQVLADNGIIIDGLPLDDAGHAQRLLDHTEGELLLLANANKMRWVAYVKATEPDKPTKWSSDAADSYVGEAIVSLGTRFYDWANDAVAVYVALLVTYKRLPANADPAKKAKMEETIEELGAVIEQLRQNGSRLRSNGGVNAVRSMCHNVPKFVVPASSFDSDPDHVVAVNCVIDLRTGGWRVFDPKYRLTRSVTCSYVPEAHSLRWETFLDEVIPDRDLQEFVQMLAGYWLTGYPAAREQIVTFFYGPTGSGKSTLMDTLCAVMGQTIEEGYAMPAPEGLLRRARGHFGSTAPLNGSHLVVDSEFRENDALDLETLKRLTGERMLMGNGKYAKMLPFLNTAKLAGVTNHLPRMIARNGQTEIDEAVLRRLVIVPMNEQRKRHERDTALPQRLADEAVGILSWMVEGATKWYRDGLVIPQAAQDAHDRFRMSLNLHDPIETPLLNAGFIWPVADLFTPTRDLTTAVNEWNKRFNESSVSDKVVADWCNLQPGLKKDRPRIDGRQVSGYLGIGKR